MQKLKPTQAVIRLLIISILCVLQACHKTKIPKETNDILLALVGQEDEKIVINLKMADSLKNEFSIPLTVNYLKNPPYFSSDYKNSIDSLISDSDIFSWNKKIEAYRGIFFDLEDVEGLPVYNPKNKKILNSDIALSELDGLATASVPFINAQNNKAIVYIEYHPYPKVTSSKNSFLIILKKQDQVWREIYRKLLVVTTP